MPVKEVPVLFEMLLVTCQPVHILSLWKPEEVLYIPLQEHPDPEGEGSHDRDGDGSVEIEEVPAKARGGFLPIHKLHSGKVWAR